MKQLVQLNVSHIRNKHPVSLTRPGGPSVPKRLIGTFDHHLSDQQSRISAPQRMSHPHLGCCVTSNRAALKTTLLGDDSSFLRISDVSQRATWWIDIDAVVLVTVRKTDRLVKMVASELTT